MPIPTAASAHAKTKEAKGQTIHRLLKACEDEIQKAIKACEFQCVVYIPSDAPGGVVMSAVIELSELGYQVQREAGDQRDCQAGYLVINW